MRKMLCVVAMLVVALVISANLPRAGPDMVTDFDSAISEVENTTYLNAAHDIGAILVIVSAEPFTVERMFTVVSSLRESRLPVVVQDRRNVRLGVDTNDAMTLLDFRLNHRPDTRWSPMRT